MSVPALTSFIFPKPRPCALPLFPSLSSVFNLILGCGSCRLNHHKLVLQSEGARDRGKIGPAAANGR